jgi:hypothetical protein
MVQLRSRSPIRDCESRVPYQQLVSIKQNDSCFFEGHNCQKSITRLAKCQAGLWDSSNSAATDEKWISVKTRGYMPTSFCFLKCLPLPKGTMTSHSTWASLIAFPLQMTSSFRQQTATKQPKTMSLSTAWMIGNRRKDQVQWKKDLLPPWVMTLTWKYCLATENRILRANGR